MAPTASSAPPPPAWPRHALWTGALLFAAVALSALPTCSGYGITWDEPIYLEATRQVQTWLSLPAADRFNAPAIDRFWRTDPQRNVHPAGIKWLYLAARHSVFWESDPYIQNRVLTILLFAAALAIFCLWIAAGRPVLAWTTAALFLTLPRCFAHVHFAATDSPMTALLLLLVPALDRGLAPRWAWIPGVLIGLAASFKITAVILCAPLLALFLACAYTDWKSCLARFWIVVLTAGIVFYLLNPDWWLTPWARLGEFAGATASRRQWAPFSLLYFGQLYSYRGPFHYPLGILLVTTPLIHLGLLVAGMLRLRLRPFRACCRHWAMVVGGAAPIVLLMVPFSPTNDMERYLLPAYPFLAAMMAVGLQPLWERFRPVGKPNGPVLHRVALAVMLSLAAGWTVSRSVRNHPRELCYFNEWVGGAAGGRRLGFEVTYWWEPLDDRALASINRICRGSTVFFPIAPTDHYFRHMQQSGRIAFVPVANLGQARHALVYGRPFAEFWESRLRDQLQQSGHTMALAWSSEWQGVPLLRLWTIHPANSRSPTGRSAVNGPVRPNEIPTQLVAGVCPDAIHSDAPASAITGVNRIRAIEESR